MTKESSAYDMILLPIKRIVLVSLVVTILAIWFSSEPSIVGCSSANSDTSITIENQIEKLAVLYEDSWNRVSEDEKLEILQIVADLEQQHLGIYHRLPVKVEDGLSCQGYYSDNYKSIGVNQDCLENEDPFTLVSLIAHEAYHAYEYRLVDALKMVSDDIQELNIFKQAEEYRNCFVHYIKAEVDYEGYFNQKVEEDSREYAFKRTVFYFKSIYQYLGIEYAAG